MPNAANAQLSHLGKANFSEKNIPQPVIEGCFNVTQDYNDVSAISLISNHWIIRIYGCRRAGN